MVDDKYPMKRRCGALLVNEEALLKDEGGEFMRSTESVRFLIIHCSASYENHPYTMEQLERDHRARGFRKAGYHFYIRRDGTVYRPRRLLEVGAHCRPYNRCSIGICYEGGRRADGLYGDTRTQEQMEELRDIVKALKAIFPRAVVTGHRDMPGATPKECPCFDVAKWWSDVSKEG